MVITLEFIGDAPQWWISIRDSENSAIQTDPDDFTTAMKIKSGFDIEFDCGFYAGSGFTCYRTITGEETEITAMILKWS